VKSDSAVTLYSRNKKILNKRFPYIVDPLRGLPDETVVDGEIVALDDDGRPDFNLLQNFRAPASRIHYCIFDLLVCQDRDQTRLPLIERRVVLKSLVSIRDKRIRISDYVEVRATELLAAVREQQLGLDAKDRLATSSSNRRYPGAGLVPALNRSLRPVTSALCHGVHTLGTASPVLDLTMESSASIRGLLLSGQFPSFTG
jgi:ATP dependent DNA ligase domain